MLTNILALAFAIALNTTFALGAGNYTDDQVETLSALPGWPNKTDFGMYSGFIPVNNTSKMIHYVFLESQTKNNTTDPLVVWFNGGPGCSSMLGFLQETGPYVLEFNATSYTHNPWSWNNETNILYIEQPAGVGYSTCDNVSYPQDCNHTDLSSSEDNLQVLLGWFARFKDKHDYSKNPLFISGESYAGIYVPYLSWQINEYNKVQASADTKINIKGFFVGNGATNWEFDALASLVDFSYYRSLISNTLNSNIEKADCNFTGLMLGDVSHCSAQCLGYFGEVLNSYQAIDQYNVYGPCYGVNASKNAQNWTEEEMYSKLYGKVNINGKEQEYKKFFTVQDYTPWMPRVKKANDTHNYGIPKCVFALPAAEHLNNATVKKQLNIDDANNQVWNMCPVDGVSTFDYTKNASASQWIYENLKGQMRMMHFSGDMDGAVSTIGTERWIQTLGWNVTTKHQPWWEYKQVAGYFQEFANALTFVTVHGAGHMVPQDQRSRAYQILFNWVFQRGEFGPPPPVPPPGQAEEEKEAEILQW